MANGSTPLNPQSRAILMREGTFHGMKTLLTEKTVSEDVASYVLRSSYGALLVQVDEAKKELQRIQNALAQMESTCRAGKQARNPRPGDGTHVQLNQAVLAFDGWVVSLMETNLTVTGMLNPTFTRTKISEFSTAMSSLMDKRAAEQHPVLDDPQLFSGYLKNY